ncbi:MAG: PEGA domain-containing protein [Thermoguttaceae bacterium]|nr:PEGA domain-containing protein [Thermoguttaceae bacterium]MDW8037181.1 PEGA domain-containing protein [Thermoguttaceae bacterium]
MPIVASTSVGCVQRRLTIRTDPPGAMAYVDGYPIGTTPISTDFIYYGTREIRLVKDGYETLVVKQRIWPPWYEIPPLDFISENLVPGELRDHRILEFRLQPQRITPPEQLVDRAERLRRGELVVPAGTLGGTGAGAPLPRAPSSAVPYRLSPPGGVGGVGGADAKGPGPWPPAGGIAQPDLSEPDIGGRSVYPLPNGGL